MCASCYCIFHALYGTYCFREQVTIYGGHVLCIYAVNVERAQTTNILQTTKFAIKTTENQIVLEKNIKTNPYM